jgi:N-acetylglucosamine malate deacetylase 1
MSKKEGGVKSKAKSKAKSKTSSKIKKKAKKVRKVKENVIVLGAHSDDFVLGAGATIAKYVKEGKKVTCIIFSYGEMSHPWLKEEEVQKMRIEEAHQAAKVLGCKTIFFDLKEGKFSNETNGEKTVKKILNIIKKKNPTKIFTHSIEDPHPDHQAVNKITLEAYDQIEDKLKPEVYVYSVWNPVEFKTRAPALLVDVGNNFNKKIEAMKKFESQKVHTLYPRLISFFRDIKTGIRIRKKFAEKFYRVR